MDFCWPINFHVDLLYHFGESKEMFFLSLYLFIFYHLLYLPFLLQNHEICYSLARFLLSLNDTMCRRPQVQPIQIDCIYIA